MRTKLLRLCLLAAFAVVGCNNVGLGPEASRGDQLDDRITTNLTNADWYNSLQFVDGEPKVEVYSAGKDNGVDVPGGDASIYLLPAATQAQAEKACRDIAGVVNDPSNGPSLSLTRVRVSFGTTWTDWCYPPQSP
jgi:hypothetical protein